jgi:hypothetical protein
VLEFCKDQPLGAFFRDHETHTGAEAFLMTSGAVAKEVAVSSRY